MIDEIKKETTTKEIFKYNNGFSDLWGDPFEIDFRIQKASELENMPLIERWIAELPRNEDGSVSDDASDESMKLYVEACHKLIPIIRKGFEIVEFDKATGDGMTSSEVLDLYSEYLEWKQGLKKI